MKKTAFALLAILILVGSAMLIYFNVHKSPQPNPQKLTKLKIGYIVSDVAEVPVAVAIKNGYFKENGLDVKVVKSVKSVNTGLISGETDIAMGPAAPFIMAAAQGSDFKAVGNLSNDYPFVFVSYKNPSEIKTIGVSRIGGETHLRSIEFFKYLKLDANNTTYQVLGTHDVLAQVLVNKNVDAGSFVKGVWLLYKNKNQISNEYKILVDTSIDKELQIPDVIFVKGSFLSKNKNLVESFSKAVLEANNWIKNNQLDIIVASINGVNGLSSVDAKILAPVYKTALLNTKYTLDLKRLDIIRASLVDFAPQTKNYNISSLLDFQISDALKSKGLLLKYGF